MNVITFLVIVFMGGYIISVWAMDSSEHEKRQVVAKEMLKGPIQKQAKGLLQALQREAPSGEKIFTPLKYFTNEVVPFLQLKGDMGELNEKLATIASTLASADRPVPAVKLDWECIRTRRVIIQVGNSGAKYCFNADHLDSLDLLQKGTGIL